MRHRLSRWALRSRWLWLLSALVSTAAAGQSPADPYSYKRVSAFSYYGAADGAKNGLLKTETIEPDLAQSCVVTTYDYDAQGNKKIATTANCAGAAGSALFASRSSTSSYAAVAAQTITVGGGSATPGTASVAIPAGLFATNSANALNHGETRQYDPRFGAVIKLTGPNALATDWLYDDFGRKIRETRADGTRTVYFHCVIGAGLDTSSNTEGCPTPAAGEAPADAVMFVHSEQRNSADATISAFSRVYSDAQGRELRVATQSFNGVDQPAGRGGVLVVTDSVYNAHGARLYQTQPYFLTSNSSTTAGANDHGVTRTDYDVLGRPVAVYVADPSGSQSNVSFGGYGTRAKAAKTSYAYAGLNSSVSNDKNQTRSEEKNPLGQLVRVTDAAGAQLAHQHDAFGNLVATKDALQNSITLRHDIRGRKTQLADPDAGVLGYCYDALGQLKAQQTSAMRGSHTLGACPNNADSGTTATAVAGWTTLAYDKLGRMTQRVEPEYTSTWHYDKYANASACTKGIGKLCESVTSHGVTRKYVYDSLGRPKSSRTDIANGRSMATSVGYDANGRVNRQTYPTGLLVGFTYTSLGYPERLTLQTGVTIAPLPDGSGATAAGKSLVAGTTLWRARVLNAWGRTEQAYFQSSGPIGKTSYEPATGRVSDITAGIGSSTSVLKHHYSWDSLNNLSGRDDFNGAGSGNAVTETFVYDALNRLSGYNVSSPTIPNLTRGVTLEYNALGQLLYKSDVGAYAYGASVAGVVKPHTLRSLSGASNVGYGYDLNGNLVSASGGKYRALAYTSFNLPDAQSGAQGPGGSPTYTWQYDEGHARIKELRSSAAGTRTTWYLHPDNHGGLGFEREENSPTPGGASYPNGNRHYLSLAGQVIGVMVSTDELPLLGATQTAPSAASSMTLIKLEYWHKDHLGSLAASTDHNGTLSARYAYDPFGKRRYGDGQYDASGQIVTDWSQALNHGSDRGYTGHEQLDDIGLVHMNGRLYDPSLGVFLQADPLIQDLAELQNYHRYAYCYNNPLTCTDPSGYFIKTLWRKIKAEWKRSELFRGIVAVGVAVVTYGYGAELGASIYAAGTTSCTAGFAAGSAIASGIGGGFVAGFSTRLLMSGGSLEAAFRGAAVGALTAGFSEFAGATMAPSMRIASQGALGGAISKLTGGSFRDGLKYSLLTELTAQGWEAATTATDSLKQLACSDPSSALLCQYNQFGELLTDGGRDIDWSRNLTQEGNFITRSGMAAEGQEHLYSSNWSASRFINRVSKVHDWMNSWNYGSNGWYLSRGVAFDTAFQLYSFSGMVPAALYTAVAFSPQYGINLELARREKEMPD